MKHCDQAIRRAALLFMLGSLALSAGLAPAAAGTSDEFFRGRTLTLIIGLPIGGGYDTYSRVLARHLGRFIAGNPSVIVQNMPGSGGLQAANYLYNVAPRDGSVFAMIAASTLLMPLFGEGSARFETTKFTWLGSMNKDVETCGVWFTHGINRFEDLFEKEAYFGASGPAAITAQHPLALNALTGSRIKVVMGYPGTHEIDLAMQRGELDGGCGLAVSSLKSQYRADWQSGRLKILIQLGAAKHPDLSDVPSMFDYARSEEDLKVMHLISDQLVLGRPLVAPPELPPDRRDALRAGVAATLKDPQFLADAQKALLEINPASAEEIETLLGQFFSYPAAIIEKAKQIQGLAR